MNEFLKKAREMDTQLRAMKDDLHRYPELGMQEVRTTARIREWLAPLGLEFLDLGMETGVAALLRGGKPGRMAALRADIDALPYQEPDTHPVVSQIPGMMHACGHDFHTAGLLGAAHLLAERREELEGDVLFIFQPAEEGTTGARAMIDHGLWEKLPRRPDCLFGLHNRPEIPCGQVAVKPGALMAGKGNYKVTVHGVSGHPGEPHRCTDVIVAGCAMVTAIQTIVSRNCDPLEPLVCAVCSIHAGNERNLIDDTLTLSGTIRAHSNAVLSMAWNRIETIAHQTAAAYGCTAEMERIPGVPVTCNPAELLPAATRAAEAVLGRENIVVPVPAMGSEDFAVLAQDVPGFFYWLGVGYPDRENAGWHNAAFETNDDALAIGAALLAQSAWEGLKG